MSKPPSTNIRLTISVTPEVHAAFQRMAEVSGMSIGRCMGEWLGDTLEGAEFVTGQLAKARQAPRQVAAEMRQMLLGGLDEADQLLADMRSGKIKVPPATTPGDARSVTRAAAAEAQTPRPVIRGGKSPGKTRRTQASSTRGGKS
jgi:hypothetical protein